MINLEPAGKGAGFVFEDKIVGGSIPREFIGPVEQGIKEALENGVLAGYPMVDVKVELIDGSFHDVDSSEIAFKIAGSMAFKEAAERAGLMLLEPIMDVEVVTPAEYMGDVMGDLASRRGKIGGMVQRVGRPRDRRIGAAGRDVRVLHDAALDEPGPRRVHDAVLALRGSPEVEGGRDHLQDEGLSHGQGEV